jgi:hypothetical protein
VAAGVTETTAAADFAGEETAANTPVAELLGVFEGDLKAVGDGLARTVGGVDVAIAAAGCAEPDEQATAATPTSAVQSTASLISNPPLTWCRTRPRQRTRHLAGHPSCLRSLHVTVRDLSGLRQKRMLGKLRHWVDSLNS